MRTNTNELDLWAAQPEVDQLNKLAFLLKDSVPEPWECPIEEVLPLCRWYYEYHDAGGWLHIVLDDGNLEDSSVDHCKRAAIDNADIICHFLALLIRTMTEENRQILYNRLHGHPDDWEPE